MTVNPQMVALQQRNESLERSLRGCQRHTQNLQTALMRAMAALAKVVDGDADAAEAARQAMGRVNEAMAGQVGATIAPEERIRRR